MVEGDDLWIEIDGEGVAPDAVDASALLRIATSVVDLVERLAVEKGSTVCFGSIKVVDKCAALAVGSDNPRIVKSAVPEVQLVLVGDRPAPRGGQGSADTLRSALRKLSPDQRVALLQRKIKQPLVIRDVDGPKSTAITSFRARLIKIGGKNPTAQFRSAFQDRITLEMKREVAIRIGALLYREMDIVAQVSYTSELDIKRGTLLEFTVVDESRDPVAELRAWYENASRGGPRDRSFN
jgi:hypothetical protein